MSAPPRARILVVDDRASQRLAIEAALAELGEEVVAVGSGLEALRLLLEGEVAVILLDVNMPDMDGFETAALIRQRPRTRHTPIIFLTADTDHMLSARAYSLGAVDFILTPFLPEVLRAKVRVFVELAKVQEQLRREAEQRIALSRAEAARAAAEQQNARLGFLAEASGVLNRSLDAVALGADLLALLVPRLADAAGLARREGQRGEIGRAWRSATAAAGEEALRPLVDRAVVLVLAAGEEERLEDPVAGVSGLVLPLVARGRTFGALTALRVGPARRFGADDLDLLRDVAGRAAVALDNCRLYQEIHARDQQKDGFLAMLSHELRNPIGAITTAAHLLESAEVAEPHTARAREVIVRQSAHLARMVDDLLDLTRVTAGRVTLTRAPADLAALVERALESLRIGGRLERHDVRLSGPPVPVMVEVDSARTEQVVTNLVVNAVKYTDPGGRIDVEVRAEGADAVVSVRDTGIGLSADMLPRLFEPFAQEPQAVDRAQGGLGLGLALVRRLVELQGGRVEARSEGPGRGSTFIVWLPRLAATAARPGRPCASARAVAPLRILLVEDNDDAREMLRALLELSGHEVHEAADGGEGLRLALSLRPHLALVDLGLPGLDGLELAARLRASGDAEGTMLVALTGYGQPVDRRRAVAAGFDLHVVKPVDGARLEEVLAQAAQRAGGKAALER